MGTAANVALTWLRTVLGGCMGRIVFARSVDAMLVAASYAARTVAPPALISAADTGARFVRQAEPVLRALVVLYTVMPTCSWLVP